MDRISRRSQGVEGVRFGDLRIGSLLFADDVVLLASSGRDLQLSLERFAAECEAAGMRISTSNPSHLPVPLFELVYVWTFLKFHFQTVP